MEPLSPLNQGLNPLRQAPLWGQLVAQPAASPAIANRVTQPVTAPLSLALQPYANARLCLFEVDRPESRSPVPIRRHVIDCFLEQSGIVSGYNDTALTDPGDVLLRGYLCRAAILPVSTSNTFDWLAADVRHSYGLSTPHLTCVIGWWLPGDGGARQVGKDGIDAALTILWSR